MANAADPPDPSLKPAIGAAVRAVAATLAALPSPGMIIGGIAVIARGVPRLTRDVDATVTGDLLELEQLLDAFHEHGIVPRISDVVAFANANQVVLLTHDPSGVDVDVSIAWLPFELEALAASERLEIAGTPVCVARAEDLIIYKAVAFRPQDQQDIERLVVLHRADLDLTRIRRVVGEFAAALDEPERVDRLDDIIRRTDPHRNE
jgi:predicted nucleotidyltransferase